MAAGDYSIGSIVTSDGVNYFTPADGQHPQFSSAPSEVKRLAMARREGSIVGLNRFMEGAAQIYGYVYSTVSLSDLEAKWDALVMACYTPVVVVKLGYQDQRYWNCYLDGAIDWHRRGPTIIEYTAKFVAPDAFGYAASASQLAPGPVALTRV